jgi:hypothetical protein
MWAEPDSEDTMAVSRIHSVSKIHRPMCDRPREGRVPHATECAALAQEMIRSQANTAPLRSSLDEHKMSTSEQHLAVAACGLVAEIQRKDAESDDHPVLGNMIDLHRNSTSTSTCRNDIQQQLIQQTHCDRKQ